MSIHSLRGTMPQPEQLRTRHWRASSNIHAQCILVTLCWSLSSSDPLAHNIRPQIHNIRPQQQPYRSHFFGGLMSRYLQRPTDGKDL